MSVQFRNVCGHIEVYNTSGEFLFSADTMEKPGRNSVPDGGAPLKVVVSGRETLSTSRALRR